MTHHQTTHKPETRTGIEVQANEIEQGQKNIEHTRGDGWVTNAKQYRGGSIYTYNLLEEKTTLYRPSLGNPAITTKLELDSFPKAPLKSRGSIPKINISYIS